MTEKTFLELVEFHERKWGTEQYAGRPALTELLHSPIVAMWRSGKRFMLSVYTKADELNDLVMGLVTGQIENPEQRILHKIYVHQQPMDFRIKIVSNKPAVDEPVDPKKTALSNKTKKEWKYPDQPKLASTRPLLEADAPFTPEIVDQRPMPKVEHVNGSRLPRKHNPKPGYPTPGRRLPGRKVSIIRTVSDPKKRAK